MTRRFFAILLMLCLPLQVQAAALMPICQQGTAPVSSAAAEQQDASHCQYAGGEQSAPAEGAGSCDRCGLCHLVGPTPPTVVLPLLPATRDYALPVEPGHLSHIPEALQEPPRRA